MKRKIILGTALALSLLTLSTSGTHAQGASYSSPLLQISQPLIDTGGTELLQELSGNHILKNKVGSKGLLGLKLPSVESSANPEVERLAPIETNLQIGPSQETPSPGNDQGAYEEKYYEGRWESSDYSASSHTSTLGPNLIENPSVEIAGAGGLPSAWLKGGYGANTRNLIYPAGGFSGKALQVSVTAYSSGDAKWFFKDVALSPGKTYRFSDFYKSNTESYITARFALSNGAYSYIDLGILSASSDFKQASVEFTAPVNAETITIFHLIKAAGALTTDEFELREVKEAADGNLVDNGSLEAADGSRPVRWQSGGWGSNTRSFVYPVAGVGGSKAARMAISSYTSGDAKWFFEPMAVSAGVYSYAVDYTSNIGGYLTARFEHQSGAISYRDLAILPPASSFKRASVDFFVPENIKNLTIFHLINKTGQMTVDNSSLIFKSAPKGVFKTGGVSLAFDDAWLSQYDNALPLLDASGFKATFYIATRQLADYGFPGYMSINQIKEVAARGHEMGAHTRTHRALTSLTASEQEFEIVGSRDDLLAMNVGSISTFAYPFGAYNATTLSIVRDNFAAARSSIGGAVQSTSPRSELPRMSVEVDTSFAEVKAKIDQAMAKKEWLILVFHQVNNSSDRYTVSPSTLSQIINYLANNDIPVVTVAEGAAGMN
jgi:peptidoglycan/xylan/chitin deacetylase (PgdA/CDA1 family)